MYMSNYDGLLYHEAWMYSRQRMNVKLAYVLKLFAAELRAITSRSETFSRWCGVVVRRGGCQLRCHPRHLTMFKMTWSIAKSPRVAEQCELTLAITAHVINSRNLSSGSAGCVMMSQ
ncbi:hypothetical protein TNCV_2927911 [Trichonephila clavipes]|nr:hypothetical protein TNCV_2927911 [Trichonephila clavipes]